MAESYDVIYSFLTDRGVSTPINKEERITIYKTFTDPISHTLKHTFPEAGLYASNYELITDGNLPFDVTDADSYTSKYINLWFIILKLQQNGAWVTNGGAASYGVTEIVIKKGYVSFVLEKKRYYVFTEIDAMEDIYAIKEEYYIFYDDFESDTKRRDNIESEDIYKVLNEFVNVLGKNNMYKKVTTYTYNGTTCYYNENGDVQEKQITQHFYLFYNKIAPEEESKKEAIKNRLIIDKGGRDQAAFEYPNLFNDEVRRVFALRENKGYPVNVNALNTFVYNNNVTNPEVILLMDWRCPIVVENGVSDVITNYSPIVVEDNSEEAVKNNQFIYYLSSILNYLMGTNDKPDFVNETGFKETDDYVQFIFSFITWQVQKNYIK